MFQSRWLHRTGTPFSSQYRFTDTSKTTVTIDLTLDQIADLRATLTKALDLDGVPRWTTRDTIRKLADAQRSAAEIMALDAKQVADAAKLGDEF